VESRADRRGRRLARVAALIALVAVSTLIGCQPGTAPSAPAGDAGTSTEPSASRGSTSSAGASGFKNPVYDSNFPDPMVVQGSKGFLAVGTNGNGSNVQTLTSTDLTSWEQGPDALPKLAKWSTAGKVWAPEVTQRADRRFVLYYTTRGPDPDVQCVGVAVGSKAEGPYVDSSTGPLVCQPKLGGSIDPSPFTSAGGERYLYWKNDGNAVGQDTYLWGQRLDRTGTKLLGEPKRLFKQTLAWEGNLVEAPFGWQDGKVFHLFYSANDYGSDSYAVGQATSSDPLGPFTKDQDPVLSSDKAAAGPGHCALFERKGRVWMVYHAWSPDAIGSDPPGRMLWLSEVTFGAKGKVTVEPPTVNYPRKP
jgi:beta-xylosidase